MLIRAQRRKSAHRMRLIILNKKPSGLFTVRLAIEFHPPYLKGDECFSLLSAGRTRGRMDLVITIVHGATILDVGRHTTHYGRGQRPDGEGSGFQCL